MRRIGVEYGNIDMVLEMWETLTVALRSVEAKANPVRYLNHLGAMFMVTKATAPLSGVMELYGLTLVIHE